MARAAWLAVAARYQYPGPVQRYNYTEIVLPRVLLATTVNSISRQ